LNPSPSTKRLEWRQGWSVVAVATVAMATGAGLYHYVSSLFVIPLETEFGWSRGDIASAAAFGMMGTFSAPVIGRLADRIGARRVGIASILTMALCFLALAAMNGTYWHFLAVAAVLGLAAPGCTTLIYGRVVNSWFEHGKGLALGVTAGGLSIGAMLFSPLIRTMIELYGSSGGYITLAALMLGLGLPFVAFGLRERTSLDGVHGSQAAETDPPDRVQQISSRWLHHLRGSTFWRLAVAIFVVNAPAAGILTQFEPIILERGDTDPTFLLMVFALAVLIGRIGIGGLFDRFDARRVATIVTAGGIVGSLLLTSSAPVSMVLPAVILIGLLQGAETDVLAYFVARHYARTSFGTVYGMLFTISMLGTAMGVIGFGHLFDRYQSYDAALIAAAVVLVPACFAYLSMPRRVALS